MKSDVTSKAFPVNTQGDRFLFLDAFIKDRRLVLVSTYYPDIRFDFSEAHVTLDGNRLGKFDEIGRNEYEPSRAIVYPLDGVPPGERHELVVSYGEHRFAASLQAESSGIERPFAVATLFKDDFTEVAVFREYYKRHGIDRFYLFYNGDLATVRHLLPDADDIVYGEWNFQYWLDTASEAITKNLVDPAAAMNKHHAQSTFLTMVRHRFLAECSYLALIDLDEFLGSPGETVRGHVERIAAPTLTAPCHWAEVRRGFRWMPRWVWQWRKFRILLALRTRVWSSVRTRLGGTPATANLQIKDLSSVWANVRSEGTRRVKTIYRGDFDGLFGVHTPKTPHTSEVSASLKLYHIVNTGHGRHTRIHPDAQPVRLLIGASSTR